MAASDLRLRPVRLEDREAALAGHEAMAGDGFSFLLDHAPGEPWSDYVARLDDQRRGLRLAPDRVPATFLLATVADELVGRVSVRHGLNDYLAEVGGHIGYGVLPRHRRRGYAVEILRQALIVARAAGVGRVLVTCDDDNPVSARVIERCSGVLDGLVRVPDLPVAVRRYWIP